MNKPVRDGEHGNMRLVRWPDNTYSIERDGEFLAAYNERFWWVSRSGGFHDKCRLSRDAAIRVYREYVAAHGHDDWDFEVVEDL